MGGGRVRLGRWVQSEWRVGKSCHFAYAKPSCVLLCLNPPYYSHSRNLRDVDAAITHDAMETCKSPRKVLNAAYALATACLKEHPSKFSRKDFTQPQLFACLVLREHQKKSYRGIEALLRDCPHWCADIGLTEVPDHNTLCRAFHKLVKPTL